MHRFKDPRHLSWIRSLGCAAQSLSCSGPIQAHHLLKPWVGSRGMGMKADDRNVIPLCAHHHQVLHTKYGSEDSFFSIHGRSEGYAKKLAEHLYLHTGD